MSAGEAESGLERLHQCAEKELQQFLTADGPLKEFNDFRTKLAGLTRYVPSTNDVMFKYILIFFVNCEFPFSL